MAGSDDSRQAGGWWQSFTRAGFQARRLAASRHAQPLLAWLSFLEAIIVPIPLEAVLVPYMLIRRDIIWRIATVALTGFLVAAILGYFVGALAFNSLGLWVIDQVGWQAAFAEIKALVGSHGFWALFLIGAMPIPSQLAMLAGGAFGIPFLVFMAAMALSRGIRYFGLALLVAWLGPRAQQLLHRTRAQPRSQRLLLRLAICLPLLALAIWLIWT